MVKAIDKLTAIIRLTYFLQKPFQEDLPPTYINFYCFKASKKALLLKFIDA